MSFPEERLRRLRSKGSIREMVREQRLQRSDLIYPIFLLDERDDSRSVSSQGGLSYLSGAVLQEQIRQLSASGVESVLLFGIPRREDKDDRGSAASRDDGPIAVGIDRIRQAAPDLCIVTDLCLCEYTSDGHCGLLCDGRIDNDLTLDRIQEIAVAQARAGSDVIAPSGMMDGMVSAIRTALDQAGFPGTLIMPYSVKFASRLYAPFKAATDSVPRESLHATHQIEVSNRRQALREAELDRAEGADLMIVKPAVTSLDLIREIRDRIAIPIAAYHVSGSYQMILKSAGNESESLALAYEILSCVKRAGADLLITYFAKALAQSDLIESGGGDGV